MLLMKKRKHLFWSPCAAHCIDLMLEDIASMKQIKETLDQAKMITEFIYNNLKVVNLMKVFTKDRDLIRPGITHFATEFISFESLIRYEADLKRMCTTNEWHEFNKDRSRKSLRWCLFFWLFAENHLVLEFRLFVFLLFHDLL